MNKSKVYFTKEITSESLVKIYEALGIELKGNVGVKYHTGEKGNKLSKTRIYERINR